MNTKRKVLERENTYKRELLKVMAKRYERLIPKDGNYVSIRLIPTDPSNSVQSRERVHFERAEKNNNLQHF